MGHRIHEARFHACFPGLVSWCRLVHCCKQTQAKLFHPSILSNFLLKDGVTYIFPSLFTNRIPFQIAQDMCARLAVLQPKSDQVA